MDTFAEHSEVILESVLSKASYKNSSPNLFQNPYLQPKCMNDHYDHYYYDNELSLSSEEEEEEFEETPLPGAIIEPEPERQTVSRFNITYGVLTGMKGVDWSHVSGSRQFLNDVRRSIDRDRNLTESIRRKEYQFLDENLDAIPGYQESSLDLERVFPSQEINIQCIQVQETKPVGPLGICSASDCTKAAKIKCLDCRNTAYCSKRCMRDDIKEHKRVCYSKIIFTFM
ncbi:uncharacterized protein CEXT_599071 [Caerostris extrusa]|uniref:MYND-type domain-containing protein n=1 Tax=Caerostris extrusa TaxID=172846 RepID=A0AAV4NPY8_CAEEX|nr:uncharacterized protein CEXT_599071 [Caerostris extrusa]